MPVILRTPEAIDVWLNAPTPEALALHRQTREITGGEMDSAVQIKTRTRWKW
jgi:hypothetical protein